MSGHPNESQLLHVKEAANRLHVKPERIRRAIHAGELPAVRLGEHGRFRIRSRDLADYLRPVETP